MTVGLSSLGGWLMITSLNLVYLRPNSVMREVSHPCSMLDYICGIRWFRERTAMYRVLLS